jgi:translation initiation factor 1
MKNNPFEGLRDRLGLPDAAPDNSTVQSPAPEIPKPDSGPGSRGRGPARAVVRMERAGRGGKEATVIEQLGLPAHEMEAWLKALKAALGCGGTIEAETLVLQGDHRKRLPAVLTSRGVRKVIVG